MAKSPLVDPALEHLRRAVDEAPDAVLPIVLIVHGERLEGDLIAENAYHAALVGYSPMLAALDPRSELADKKYATAYTEDPEHYLHLLVASSGGRATPWRVREDAVDAWSFAGAEHSGEDKGREPNGLARLFAPRDV